LLADPNLRPVAPHDADVLRGGSGIGRRWALVGRLAGEILGTRRSCGCEYHAGRGEPEPNHKNDLTPEFTSLKYQSAR
jgi:hypothetical protein